MYCWLTVWPPDSTEIFRADAVHGAGEVLPAGCGPDVADGAAGAVVAGGVVAGAVVGGEEVAGEEVAACGVDVAALGLDDVTPVLDS